MRRIACLFLATTACGASAAAGAVRVYTKPDQVAQCEDLGSVRGHASGWGDRYRANAENDAREKSLALGADAMLVTAHDAGFTGHFITAEAFRCDARAQVAPVALAKPMRLLVMEFRVIGGEPRLGQILTGLVTASLQQVKNLTVTDRADIDAALGAEKQRDLLGCDSSACLAELGGALGTRYLVYGSIGSIGSQYAVSANLFDTQRSRALVRFARTVAHEENNLVALVPELAGVIARGMPAN